MPLNAEGAREHLPALEAGVVPYTCGMEDRPLLLETE